MLAASAVAAVKTTSAPAEQHVALNHLTNDLTSSMGVTVVVFPLSESVRDLLGVSTHDITIQSRSLSINLATTIESSEIIWQSKACQSHAVVRCSADIVVKIVPNLEDYTEYTSMQYLTRHAPLIPIPKPLGLVVSNTSSYIFMSFVQGISVSQIWSKLSKQQKVFISNQLNDALLRLRQLKVPDGVPLGGVCGEGCKDTRRHTRHCQETTRTCAEFEDFKFSNPHFGSSEYITLLRSLSQSHEATVLFSHGDLRPDNVVVQLDPDGNYKLAAILDWEKSGYYPDYFECIKATNNLSSSDTDDWYLYLPACASPMAYPLQWLLDRIWDVHVA